MNTNLDFLGVGIAAPLRESHSGEFASKEGKENILASLQAIVSTATRHKDQKTFIPGERFMRDDFGSKMKFIRHESLDFNAIALAESYLIEAIEQYEPRIEITNLRSVINENEQSISIHVSSHIKATNEPLNFVAVKDSRGNININTIEGD